MLEHVERLEVEFWEHGSSTNGLIHSMSCLRNRFYYLYTLQSTVRGESMWFATLSDMWNFTVHPPMEPQAYKIFCMLIRIGKANQAGSGKTLLGRVLRHKNVLMCGYGAFGLYMLCQFMVTKEDKTIDFTKNDNWFKIKVMVGGDANATNNKTAVSNRRFDEAIRKHQKNLGINSCHKLHFGRAEMPSLLELMEVDPEYIRPLGNWDQHAYDKAYSGKMPLPLMRGSGGHATEKGLHFSIRGQVDPAEELEKQLFTFVEREDAKIRALPNYHTMTGAQTFLKVMKDLRRVILQDAAAMQLAGRNHVLFRTHPVFSHPLFIEFKTKMEVALEAAKNQDPLDLSIERLLPRIALAEKEMRRSREPLSLANEPVRIIIAIPFR